MYCITAVISVCLIQHGTAAFACVCMFQSESLKEEEEAEQRRKKKDVAQKKKLDTLHSILGVIFWAQK